MPLPGRIWRHVVISTRNTWRPGDARGWRSRHHKRHSSGDYRNPPPKHEHAGIRRHSDDISSRPVTIPRHLRPTVGQAILDRLNERGWNCLVISISATHVHLLVELPADPAAAKREIGQCKRRASHAVRSEMLGRIWADGGRSEPVRDAAHPRNTFEYILTQQGEGAWVWSFRDGGYPGRPASP